MEGLDAVKLFRILTRIFYPTKTIIHMKVNKSIEQIRQMANFTILENMEIMKVRGGVGDEGEEEGSTNPGTEK